jgi:hypothetical protein
LLDGIAISDDTTPKAVIERPRYNGKSFMQYQRLAFFGVGALWAILEQDT